MGRRARRSRSRTRRRVATATRCRRPCSPGVTSRWSPGAPDLRGTWHVVDARAGAEPLPADHPIRAHVERIEQAGNRVVVTSDGIVHDMVCRRDVRARRQRRDGTRLRHADRRRRHLRGGRARAPSARPARRRSAPLAGRRAPRVAVPHRLHGHARARRADTPGRDKFDDSAGENWAFAQCGRGAGDEPGARRNRLPTPDSEERS